MGSARSQSSSFILVNINRLITPSGNSKVSFLNDQAVNKNAMFIGITETWLHEGVFDAEVSHSFQGFSVLRCDRVVVLPCICVKT